MIWLTGLSGAGKSTIAARLHDELVRAGETVVVLDGDTVRPLLCKGLGFTPADRIESVRRIASAGKELVGRGIIVVVPVIAPYRSMRDEIRREVDSYIEVFVNAPLSVCEARDPKGLYQRARAGEIANFTGIDDPYEPPSHPDLEVRTDLESIDHCVLRIQTALNERRLALVHG